MTLAGRVTHELGALRDIDGVCRHGAFVSMSGRPTSPLLRLRVGECVGVLRLSGCDQRCGTAKDLAARTWTFRCALLADSVPELEDVSI